MYLARLEVDSLRVLDAASFAPGSGLNVIAGRNGAGKTSLLESIHILGTGRSFRSRRLDALVRRGASELSVFGEVVKQGGGRVAIGVARGRQGMRVRVGGQSAESSSSLAQELSLALVTPDSHRLLSGGPKERRRVLDWGLFHVERGYLQLLQRYGRTLRQRNAEIRKAGSGAAITAWDRELVAVGEQLNSLREGYVQRFEKTLQEVMWELLELPVAVGFRRGWSQGQSLDEALGRMRVRDRAEGLTSVGPHRADLRFLVEGVPVVEALSRGQAKLFVSAVELARAKGVSQAGGEAPVVLVDDLPSELDTANRRRFMDVLAGLGGQVFVTAVEERLLPTEGWERAVVFHVERGRVREVV
ncbi:MAG: DNA replication/repair protein RecF [Gammaproteobacteria bacterium]|nr:DNA replication/repair protein RecF [Gammaproteobacteria bacterium]